MDSHLLLSRLHGLPTTDVPFSKTSIAFVLFLAYLLLVRLLRFSSLRKLEKNYAHLLENPYVMTYKEAQKINHFIAFQEFPYMMRTAGLYALIKSYGISRGTALLVKTKQLSTIERIGKRLDDTGNCFMESLAGDMDGERALRALSKVNWLHARFPTIANGEFLHTLYITGLEAVRYIDSFEWRKLTELEKVAVFVIWREIGLRMGVRDIPPTLQAFTEWTLEYQETEMYYKESNQILADTAIEMITRDAPKWQRGFLKNVVSVFIEEKVRRAIGMDDPPRWVETLVFSGYHIRAFMIRNLFLPRFSPIDALPKRDPSDARLYKTAAGLEPWYIKDTFWNRWLVWLGSKGKRVPGPEFKSNGFLPEELGPLELEKVSKEPVIKQAEAMRVYIQDEKEKIAGCPFMYGNVGAWK
jgi:hypothetical protein